MPTTPVTRDEAYEGIDTFNRSMSVPFGSLGVQRGRGAGGRGEMLRQSASIEPMAFGAGRGRGGTFKRSASLGATALGPSQSRAASFKRSNTLSSIGTRANTAVVAASASGRSAGRQRVAPVRFLASRLLQSLLSPPRLVILRVGLTRPLPQIDTQLALSCEADATHSFSQRQNSGRAGVGSNGSTSS